MGIAQKHETFVSPEDRSWLRVAMGTDVMDAGTLSVDAFLAGAAFLASYANGDIPSGVPLGRLTAAVNGIHMLVPYDNTAADGSQTCVGLLGTTKSLGVTAGQFEPCAVFWGPGEVILSKLPIALDAPGQADLAAHIKFVA